MREKVVLVGAGSAMFTRGLVADLIERGWEADLALVDVEAQALETAAGLTRKMIKAARAPVRVEGAIERRDVLEGATAVICTVGVGGRRAWERDVFIPRKYGIFQPVGDTVMPGGSSRALRMVPAMVDVARDVLDLCPQALFFNYGNPMAPVCRAVRKATGANVVGLCHGVNYVAGYLAGRLGVAAERLSYTAVGMNHLTWFTEILVDGRDAMADLLCAPVDAENPLSGELLKVFGAFPAVLDRHVAEFFPWMFRGEGAYYGKTLGVDGSSFEETIARGDRIYSEMRESAEGDAPLGKDYFEQIGGEHEQVLEIIESVRTDAGRIYSANLPNVGQAPNLPGDAVVEAPAVAGAFGIRPLAQPPLPPGVAGTLSSRLQWVETIVEAALEGNRDKFVQALIIDGAVDSVKTARALADELIAAQAEHLPQFAA